MPTKLEGKGPKIINPLESEEDRKFMQGMEETYGAFSQLRGELGLPRKFWNVAFSPNCTCPKCGKFPTTRRSKMVKVFVTGGEAQPYAISPNREYRRRIEVWKCGECGEFAFINR